MRIGILVAGAILLVLALVLTFVPFIQTASRDVRSNAPSSTSFQSYIVNETGFSLVGKIGLSVSWTANAPVRTVMEICSNGGFSGPFLCVGGGTPSWPGNGSGTSGRASFSVVTNTSVLIAMYSTNATTGHVNVYGSSSNLGLIVLVIGIILLILGIVLKRRKKSQPTSAPAEPTTPSTPRPP